MTNFPIRIATQFTQSNGSWAENRAAWLQADELGVDAIFNTDHFFPMGWPENHEPYHEAWSMIAALAEVTSHAMVGCLVLGNSYRNPNLTADIARTVDHISGGRAILGIGSGWYEPDYVEYGYEFGTPGSRLRDLARDLPIIKDRLGKLNPGPVNGKLPIMIGGAGEKVTLRLVAEHADIWHVNGDLETAIHKSKVLDEWCANVGRDPNEIERSAHIQATDLASADAFVDAGFTHLLVQPTGNGLGLDGFEEVLEWRDKRNNG